MCLFVKGSEKLSKKEAIEKLKKIAKKDITVYKVMIRTGERGVYKGYYQSHFKYKSGYHYYQDGKEAHFTFSKEKGKSLLVDRGLHSFKFDPGKNWGNIVTLECTIPKGATYYEGDFNEYVSNELIIVKRLYG